MDGAAFAGATPGLLVGAAVVLLLTRPDQGRRRLADLGPPPEPPPLEGRSASTRLGACLLAGLAIGAVVGGPVGVVLGMLAAGLGPRALAHVDAGPDEDGEVAAALPLALELLAACLAGGAVPVVAVQAVADGVGGRCGTRLARVAGALLVGTPPQEAWRALGHDRGPAGAAARALARAAEGGAPVAVAVRRVASQARREQQAAAERRARRAGVLAVLPLGLCFLPAFLLLGVVPAVLGLAGPILGSL